MAMDEKGLGQRLQSARKAAGMTQQDLCQQAGISYSTLAKIERGAIKSPSVFTVMSIAGAVGVTLDSLLSAGQLQAVHRQQPSSAATPKLVSRNGVRFVYFDVNGCIVRFFQAAFTKLATDNHARADEVETAFWHYNDAVCRGDMTMEEFNAAYAQHLGLKHLDWMKYYLDTVEPIDEMHEMVRWASEHYHVGLLTNIMPGFIDAMRQRGLLPDVKFDVIVDSSQVHAIKPEREIFKLATEHAKVKAEEILFVDDDRANVMAAERYGWHVLWFDDYRPAESVYRIRESLAPGE